MFEGIKNFYNNFNESLSNTLSERMLKSGKSDFTIWDGYKAFFEESFDVSNKAVFDPMKKPIKDAAKVLDAYINDGDDTNITVAESLWNTVKGFGKMADKMVSAEDLVTTSGMVLTWSAGVIHKTSFNDSGNVLYKGVFDSDKCKELLNLSTPDEDLSFVKLRDYNAGIEKIYRGEFQDIIDKFILNEIK